MLVEFRHIVKALYLSPTQKSLKTQEIIFPLTQFFSLVLDLRKLIIRLPLTKFIFPKTHPPLNLAGLRCVIDVVSHWILDAIRFSVAWLPACRFSFNNIIFWLLHYLIYEYGRLLQFCTKHCAIFDYATLNGSVNVIRRKSDLSLKSLKILSVLVLHIFFIQQKFQPNGINGNDAKWNQAHSVNINQISLWLWFSIQQTKTDEWIMPPSHCWRKLREFAWEDKKTAVTRRSVVVYSQFNFIRMSLHAKVELVISLPTANLPRDISLIQQIKSLKCCRASDEPLETLVRYFTHSRYYFQKKKRHNIGSHPANSSYVDHSQVVIQIFFEDH